MCICFYTLQDPHYALILATNRDEFLQRPATAAHFWPTENDTPGPILAGKDVTGGGTWCGINTKTGKFGLLTNVREEVSTRTLRSRGKLVSDWLEDESSTIQSHIDTLSESMMEYAGYNLLLGHISSPNPSSSSVDTAIQMGFLSNRSEAVDVHGSRATEHAQSHDHSMECVKNLQDAHGHGVLSNGALVCDSSQSTANSAWPKMEIGRRAFANVLKRHNELAQEANGDTAAPAGKRDSLVDDLLDSVLSLAAPEVRNKEDVRSSVLVTPFQLVLGQHTSPPAGLASSWYATRAQTILLVDRQTGQRTYVERLAYYLGDNGFPVWSGEKHVWEF